MNCLWSDAINFFCYLMNLKLNSEQRMIHFHMVVLFSLVLHLLWRKNLKNTLSDCFHILKWRFRSLSVMASYIEWLFLFIIPLVKFTKEFFEGKPHLLYCQKCNWKSEIIIFPRNMNQKEKFCLHWRNMIFFKDTKY